LSAQERDRGSANAASDDEADALGNRNDIECAGLVTGNPAQGYQSLAARLVWPALLGGAVALLSAAGGWGLATERSELKNLILNLEKKQSREIAASKDRKTAIATLQRENLSLTLQLQSLSRKHRAVINQIENLQLLPSEMTNEIVFDSSSHSAPQEKAMKNADSSVARSGSESDVSVSPEVNPVMGELWFVNFGAYPRVDAARTWSLRLREKGHSTVIQDVMTAEGENLYRLRVVNLPSRAAAKVLAAQLEDDYNLEPLWFGKDPDPF
tara:strand:- start:11176 stop:11982 length:807 start_codon:yes stop_codon:yes gene_type:complete